MMSNMTKMEIVRSSPDDLINNHIVAIHHRSRPGIDQSWSTHALRLVNDLKRWLSLLVLAAPRSWMGLCGPSIKVLEEGRKETRVGTIEAKCMGHLSPSDRKLRALGVANNSKFHSAEKTPLERVFRSHALITFVACGSALYHVRATIQGLGLNPKR